MKTEIKSIYAKWFAAVEEFTKGNESFLTFLETTADTIAALSNHPGLYIDCPSLLADEIAAAKQEFAAQSPDVTDPAALDAFLLQRQSRVMGEGTTFKMLLDLKAYELLAEAEKFGLADEDSALYLRCRIDRAIDRRLARLNKSAATAG